MIKQETSVTRPKTTPLRSSILDHATVETLASFGLRNNQGLWPSYSTLDTLNPTPICPDPLDQEVKVFDFVDWVTAFEFAVYAGVQCNNVGLERDDAKSELLRVFEANEGRGVEKALLENAFGAATDLTPSTGVITPSAALAILEGYAARTYAGIPTLHLPRAAATLLGDKIVWEGDKAFTRNGSKVAIGGGYDTEDFEQNGELEMFATGEVFVEQSEKIEEHAIAVVGDGASDTGSSDPNQLTDNSSILLVERMYRVATDGFIATVTAKGF